MKTRLPIIVLTLSLSVFILGTALSGCSLVSPDVYTVTFDSNGGSAVAPAEGIKEGDPVSEPTAPTKDGYSFEGWYSDAGLTSSWDFSSDTVTEATTLYAKWSASTGTAYTVDHYQQDVSGDGYSKVTADTQNLQGTTGETATATAKSYTGFSENTTHTDRVASGTIAGDGSLVLKLYYDRNTYTVSYEENGGSSVTDTTDVRYGAKITAPTAPTKIGYSFEGWYTDAGLSSSWDFSSDTVTEATTLYAKWSASTGTAYTVEHYQQDVSGDGYSKVTADTQNLQGTTGETATATAKSYTGFSENTTHTDRVASGTIAGDGSLVLKLYYDRNTFTVSYEENGGSSVTDTTDVRYGAMISAPTAPTKDGYSFEGWYADVELTSSWDFSSDTVTEATTLYAKWKEPTVGDLGPAGGYIFYDDTVGFDFNDDSTIASDEKDLLDGTNDGIVNGDRYLEVAPYGWDNGGDDPLMMWGANNVYIPDIKGMEIGDGETNTFQIVNTAGDAALAAKACNDYSVTVGETTYDDWFLPSKYELFVIYKNLHVSSLGGFLNENGYWSSTAINNTTAFAVIFDTVYNGASTSYDREDSLYAKKVRPVRAY